VLVCEPYVNKTEVRETIWKNSFIFPTGNNRIDECMLSMLGNMLLSRTFGHVCEKVTGGWGK
jgi:hypothetical protein